MKSPLNFRFLSQRLNEVLFHSYGLLNTGIILYSSTLPAAAAAAKSLQSCPTLCDPIDSSPPGSPVPGIPQARTLEWIAISFSNAWKRKVKVKLLRPNTDKCEEVDGVTPSSHSHSDSICCLQVFWDGDRVENNWRPLPVPKSPCLFTSTYISANPDTTLQGVKGSSLVKVWSNISHEFNSDHVPSTLLHYSTSLVCAKNSLFMPSTVLGFGNCAPCMVKPLFSGILDSSGEDMIWGKNKIIS